MPKESGSRGLRRCWPPCRRTPRWPRDGYRRDRLIALLPQTGTVQTVAAATLRPVASNRAPSPSAGLVVVAVLLAGFVAWTAWTARAPNPPPAGRRR